MAGLGGEPAAVVRIDGAEGGGQILRNSLSFGALLGVGVEVFNIRGCRNPPGLKNQHLAGVKLVHAIAGGSLGGAALGSTEVTLNPSGGLSGGTIEADAITAGSCTLLTQIAFPLLLFAGSGDAAPAINTLRAKGGTDVGMSPPLDYLRLVFLPHAALFGAEASLGEVRRGVFPRGGGVMELAVRRLGSGGKLHAASILNPGGVVKVSGCCFVTPASGRSGEEAQALKGMVEAEVRRAFGDGVAIEVSAVAAPAAGHGAGVVVRAETDTGCIIGGSALKEKRSTYPGVAAEAVRALAAEVKRGVCVDEHMQDQLLILAALAEGESRYLCGPITEHTESAVQVARTLAGCAVAIEPVSEGKNIISVKGIGYTQK